MCTVNRFNDMAIKQCAKAALSRFASMWTYFDDEIRDAMLDSAIMDEVRRADSADSGFTFTASDLIHFRLCVARALADGVFVGKSKRGLMFDRDREERREHAAYERGVEAGRSMASAAPKSATERDQ
jgi:hypothetical protein